jgi:hypothetical protein
VASAVGAAKKGGAGLDGLRATMPLYFLSSSSALNKNEDFFFQVLLETKLSSNPSAKIWSQALYPTNQKRL